MIYTQHIHKKWVREADNTTRYYTFCGEECGKRLTSGVGSLQFPVYVVDRYHLDVTIVLCETCKNDPELMLFLLGNAAL